MFLGRKEKKYFVNQGNKRFFLQRGRVNCQTTDKHQRMKQEFFFSHHLRIIVAPTQSLPGTYLFSTP